MRPNHLHTEVLMVQVMSQFLKILHENVSHSHAISMLDELIAHPKTCGSQTTSSSSMMALSFKTDHSASVFLKSCKTLSTGTLVKKLTSETMGVFRD
jgi:hypothetical protein